MARSRAKKARRKTSSLEVRAVMRNNGKARKARRKTYSRHRQQHSRRVSRVDRYRRFEQKAYSQPRGQDTSEEKYPIQEDKAQKQDALDYAVSGGHFESNRRKH